ncbi:MAG: FtsX-like permease family protein [Clostridiaceae bacterium]|nr:FtsX-like permease family protein [Clostridiaceae bacterium]
MNSRRFLYAIRDGFINLKRHPLVLIASVTTMMLLILIGSSFGAFAINLRNLVEIAGQKPPIEIMFKTSTIDADAENFDKLLEENPDVIFHKINTPQENYEIFIDSLGKEELFKDFDYTKRIPYTINVRLADPALGEEFRNWSMQNPNIKDVYMEDELMKILNQLLHGVTTVSIIVMLIFTLITIFIISNMIRIAALARSYEINIMKYIGATNSYIRIPFIIQGMVVGFVGSVLSSVIFGFGYNAIYRHFGQDILNRADFALIAPNQILPIIILISIIAGLLIGAIFSGLAIRKYINV